MDAQWRSGESGRQLRTTGIGKCDSGFAAEDLAVTRDCWVIPNIRICPTRLFRRSAVQYATLAILLLAATFLSVSCTRSPLDVLVVNTQTFSIAVGQEATIQLGTVGPGEFVDPPTLTGSAIQFLGVTTPPGVPVPSGVRQIFHFKGVASGRAIILFHNTATDGHHPDVVDTVNVR